jgi:hypothetical protein
MRFGGILLLAVAFGALAACSGRTPEPSGPRGLTEADVGIPRERAAKVLKVLESASDHNDRLQRMDQQLFAEDTK